MEQANAASYLFHQGTNYRAHNYLGAHREGSITAFRVWAPNAIDVFLVGDFNGWDDSCPMKRITENGVWEIYVPSDKIGDGCRYKFKIKAEIGFLYKQDPYGRMCETPPDTASVFYDTSGYVWQDGDWLDNRRGYGEKFYSLPMNIYEMHLGSWKRDADGKPLGYRELAKELAPYVKRMGYTHIELMPVMEYPYDGSWGYQVCGYFAPTSRYGTPDDFKYFIDYMHCAGIGVILDWVPAHFPKDAHGLYEFDGQPLYEYQGADRMEHRGWGTRKFDLGRNEVECFLVSNAAYWADEFHADGLRVDAVASMLYLDYDKLPGEWVPNIYGDNRCLEAVAFFKKLNSHMAEYFPDVLMIAEESSAWGHITGFEDDGLGFSLKWNMGWMNDTLGFIGTDFLYRYYKHEKLTFSMMYAFGEKYILPISHDEVVHGKKSLLDKNCGDYWRKFAGTRAYMTYMMTHPGKKLMFMGGEIGQFREWDFEGQIEWFLLDYEKHEKLQYFVSELNGLYLSHNELWQTDNSWDGFKWIDADNKKQNIISYIRINKKGEKLCVLVNFKPDVYEDYRLGVPSAGVYTELINSDDERFGGSGVINKTPVVADKVSIHGQNYSIKIRIPPLAAVIFKKLPSARGKKSDK